MTHHTDRPAAYCSERYNNPFPDRRSPGAGGQRGSQPFARLDRVRYATYTGRKAAINLVIPRRTNFEIVLGVRYLFTPRALPFDL